MSLPISPSVVLTVRARSPNDLNELELLVFWRGSPGWFSTGVLPEPPLPTISGNSPNRGGVWSQWVSGGAHMFQIRGDATAHTAEILRGTFNLTEGNAILIDGVDSPEGPRVVGTLLVDTRLSSPVQNSVLAILRSSPELAEYLRCDRPLPQTSRAPLVGPFVDVCNLLRLR